MSDLSWFIVIADLEEGLTDVQSFGDRTGDALAEYSRLESEARRNSRFEIVMISADDESSLRALYPHYFTGLKRPEAKRLAREWINLPAFSLA